MILVTGGNGLLGSRLAADLVKGRNRVRMLLRPGADLSFTKRLFEKESLPFGAVEMAEGDVLDVFSLTDALKGITHVYHCAAMVSFDSRDHRTMMKVNAEGTANVVNMCLDAGVSGLCHVSSVAAIGRTAEETIITEQNQWKTDSSNSMYSISKFAAEREVWRGSVEGLECVIVNPSIIIGPGPWNRSSAGLFRKVWEGLSFYTEGVNSFVDVRDVSKAMIMLMKSDIRNERFILASENISYRQAFDAIADALGKKRPSFKAGRLLSEVAWRAESIRARLGGSSPLITRETARTAHAKYFYSSEKIKKALGIEFIPVLDSIAHAGKWYRDELQA
jgi:nucleoside-diphosphate-sugar epimerase